MASPEDPHGPDPAPTSLQAAAAALETISEAVRSATVPPDRQPDRTSSEQALAALLLLRELRGRLAGWEPWLIETARETGASWAELAHPLGVASRQAAERRYLRVRPGSPGATGEQRVQDTRDRRAADRTVTSWARGNAADLRQLAGQVTALTDLPVEARGHIAQLADALAQDDAAQLVTPLTEARQHLTARHADLAARVDTMTRHADQLRQVSGDQRRATN
ncbi:type III effector protein [Streptomyces botrytidirepellens]|uniref:Type III effector protein n=1 Tax=Streptomyces botrytidirepellens TaxID=2486417 RepID=A0A3M8WFC0_9ACTN|nr:type III effector protein [Streptomyces botrytidirepellens]RNG28782.1 type III effector protein [Streptomyces botrytidirepellens]